MDLSWTSPLGIAVLAVGLGLAWVSFGVGTYWLSRAGRVGSGLAEGRDAQSHRR